MSYRTLQYNATPPTVSIVLSRPRASNRVNLAMAMELRQACQRLREEDGARVAILTGRGRTFSSGRESFSFSRRTGHARTGLDRGLDWLRNHRAASALGEVELPLIAAINGDAIDHGLELALACDLRIAARGAQLGFTDLSRGIVPWDGGTQRLPRIVGRALALELLFTSRLLDADEAYRAGLVSLVVEPERLMATAQELALKVASGAPIATRYAKEAVVKGMDGTLEQGLRLEADLNLILQSTADRAEGLRAFLDKRRPEYSGE